MRIHLTAQGHAAAGEAVLLQHALQHLHVGGDIHGVVLEELVKLLLEASTTLSIMPSMRALAERIFSPSTPCSSIRA